MNYGEPWSVDENGGLVENKAGQIVACACNDMWPENTVFEQDGPHISAAYMARIVACVNACEGIKNPEKAIPNLLDAFPLTIADFE